MKASTKNRPLHHPSDSPELTAFLKDLRNMRVPVFRGSNYQIIVNDIRYYTNGTIFFESTKRTLKKRDLDDLLELIKKTYPKYFKEVSINEMFADHKKDEK